MDKKNTPESKIDRLQKSLYAKDELITRTKTGILHPEKVDVSYDWSTQNEKETRDIMHALEIEEANQEALAHKKGSFIKKFFISSLLFFFVAVGFGIYAFFIKSKLFPEGNITIGVVGSTFTKAGEALPLKVQIENKNDFELEIVDLIVEYPKEGAVPTGSLETTERERISLGTIAPRKQVVTEVPITLFGTEGDKKEINFILEYSIANSSTIFQKEKVYKVTLSSSPIITSIVGSEIAVPGQPYTFSVVVSTNTSKPLENILMAVNYPAGFTFSESSEPPLVGTNTWDIGTLVPGAPKTIQIKGQFSGINGDERSIRVLFGTYIPPSRTKISTNLGTLIQTVTLEKPFVSTDLFVNGQVGDTVVIESGEQIQGRLVWVNNLKNQVLDLEIQVRLKGELLNRKLIDTPDGFYNSSIDAIVWNKNTVDSFVRVAENQNGEFYFSIPTFNLKKDGTEKNPTIELDVLVRGIEDSDGNTPKTIESLERVTLRVGGDISVTPFVRHATGPIQNTGPYPPVINEETTYTVGLKIDNHVNTYENAELRAKFPPGVRFTNVFIPQNEAISYDSLSGELIFRMGRIDPIGDNAKTGFIQVAVTPSLQQVGSYIPLLHQITFTAEDAFTRKKVVETIGTLTTEIRNVDGEQSGMVVKE